MTAGNSMIRNPNRTRVFVCRGLQLVTAVVFLWSSVEHLRNPFFFLSSVLKYKLIGGLPAMILAGFLPVFQLFLGAMILLAVSRQLSCCLSASLLTVFAFVQVSALARGLEIGCGCFGPAHNAPITIYTVARVAVLAAAMWWTLWIERRVHKPSGVPDNGSLTRIVSHQASAVVEIGV